MRIEPRNVCLALLLAVLLGAELFLRDPAAATRAPLLPGLDPAGLTSVAIERGDGRVVLLRGDTGWTVREREGFPAHEGAVAELLTRVRGLSTADVVAVEASSHERYGLGEEATRLSLAGEDGTVSLLVGRPAEGAGSYVRVSGSDEVVRAAALAPPEPRPESWLRTRLLELDPADVRVVRVVLDEAAGTGEVEVHRRGDGRWAIVGGDASVAARDVDPLLFVAANLYFSDLSTEPEDGNSLAEPELVVSFHGADGVAHALHLGPAGDGGARPAADPAWPSPWVVSVPGKSAGALVAAARALLAAADRP